MTGIARLRNSAGTQQAKVPIDITGGQRVSCEEMANDDLMLADIEGAISNGKIRRRFTRDPRGTRYEVVGLRLTGVRSQSVAGSKPRANFF